MPFYCRPPGLVPCAWLLQSQTSCVSCRQRACLQQHLGSCVLLYGPLSLFMSLVMQGYGQSAWDDKDLHCLLERSPDWKDVLDREREKDLAGGALLSSTAIGSEICTACATGSWMCCNS
jgi:hypothetical protein